MCVASHLKWCWEIYTFKHTIYVNGVMLNIVVEKLLKCREMLNTVKCIIFWLWKGGRGGGMEWCIEKTKLQTGVAST